MLIFGLWCFLAVIVGLFASNRRNRNGPAWFLLAVVISPFLAFLIVAASTSLPTPTIPNKQQNPTKNQIPIAVRVIGVIVLLAVVTYVMTIFGAAET